MNPEAEAILRRTQAINHLAKMTDQFRYCRRQLKAARKEATLPGTVEFWIRSVQRATELRDRAALRAWLAGTSLRTIKTVGGMSWRTLDRITKETTQ